VYDGTLCVGERVVALHGESAGSGTITKLYAFEGLSRVEVPEVAAGDIAMMAGVSDVCIGDTLAHSAEVERLPSIAVDEPTIELSFLVNNSPFAGRAGKYVTSRQIRERLEKELEVNVGLRVDFSAAGGGERFVVRGRGELHIAILLEQMRREGYEVQISQPQVIEKVENGQRLEPFEEVTIDVPEEAQGAVIEALGTRGCMMQSLEVQDRRARIIFEGPTRGLFGYRSQFVIDTKGEGILATRVLGFRPHAGEIAKRPVGSMISQVTGKTLRICIGEFANTRHTYIKENTRRPT
jgi:Predicted membrane GTPase involved in stress response